MSSFSEVVEGGPVNDTRTRRPTVQTGVNCIARHSVGAVQEILLTHSLAFVDLNCDRLTLFECYIFPVCIRILALDNRVEGASVLRISASRIEQTSGSGVYRILTRLHFQ